MRNALLSDFQKGDDLNCSGFYPAHKLGTGDGFSVRQVIDQAKHVTNRPVPVTHGAHRPGICTKLVSGSLRAKTELGWWADRSNLKQMITDAWRWHQSGGYTK